MPGESISGFASRQESKEVPDTFSQSGAREKETKPSPEIHEVDSDLQMELDLLHRSMSAYARREIFSSRNELSTSLSSLTRTAIFIDRLRVIGNNIELIERNILAHDKEKKTPDISMILAEVKPAIKKIFLPFLKEYYRDQEEIDAIVERNPPESLYGTMVGRGPKGKITQERTLNSIVWYFENKEDSNDYYLKRGYTLTQIKKIGGEVCTLEIDGQNIALITYPGQIQKEVEIHETRHVVNGAVFVSRAEEMIKNNNVKSQEEFRELLKEIWTQKLANEIIAYLQSAMECEEPTRLGILLKFSRKGLYDYPAQNKKQGAEIYEKIFGDRKQFNEIHTQAAREYQALAEKIVQAAVFLFDEARFNSLWNSEKYVFVNKSPDDDFYHYDSRDPNRITGLRIIELLPVTQWPKFSERIKLFRDVSEDTLTMTVQLWEMAAFNKLEKRWGSAGWPGIGLEEYKEKVPRLIEALKAKAQDNPELQQQLQEVKKIAEEMVRADDEYGDTKAEVIVSTAKQIDQYNETDRAMCSSYFSHALSMVDYIQELHEKLKKEKAHVLLESVFHIQKRLTRMLEELSVQYHVPLDVDSQS